MSSEFLQWIQKILAMRRQANDRQVMLFRQNTGKEGEVGLEDEERHH